VRQSVRPDIYPGGSVQYVRPSEVVILWSRGAVGIIGSVVVYRALVGLLPISVRVGPKTSHAKDTVAFRWGRAVGTSDECRGTVGGGGTMVRFGIGIGGARCV
jgi:hypothetical protein